MTYKGFIPRTEADRLNLEILKTLDEIKELLTPKSEEKVEEIKPAKKSKK